MSVPWAKARHCPDAQARAASRDAAAGGALNEHGWWAEPASPGAVHGCCIYASHCATVESRHVALERVAAAPGRTPDNGVRSIYRGLLGPVAESEEQSSGAVIETLACPLSAPNRNKIAKSISVPNHRGSRRACHSPRKHWGAARLQRAQRGMARKYDSYLRDLAEEYRKRAEQTGSEDTKQEVLGLAAVCEEVANVEDHLATG
jgi:hypothetical protein